MFEFSIQRCILVEFLTFPNLSQSSDFIGRLETKHLTLSQAMFTSVLRLVSTPSSLSLCWVCQEDGPWVWKMQPRFNTLAHVCESWWSWALSTRSQLWVHRNELHINQVRCRDSSYIANLMLENVKHWRLYLLFWQDLGSADTGAAKEDEYESKLSETEFGFHHEVSSAWVVVKCSFGGHNNKAQCLLSALLSVLIKPLPLISFPCICIFYFF